MDPVMMEVAKGVAKKIVTVAETMVLKQITTYLAGNHKMGDYVLTV